MIKKFLLAFLLCFYVSLNFSANVSAVPYSDFGKIKAEYKGDISKHVYLILDNRNNLTAQESIYNLLSYFCKQESVSFIFVPDFFGIIDVAVFSTFPDKDIKKDVSYSFLKQGLMSAPEYFAVNSDTKPVLYGLEQSEYYQEFMQLMELLQLGEATDMKGYLLSRMQKNAVGLSRQVLGKKIEKSVALITQKELDTYIEALVEKGISYTVIEPLSGDEKINLKKAYVPGLTADLGRNLPVRMTLLEHDKYRIYFMNYYISLLKGLKDTFAGNDDYQSVWKTNLNRYIADKKEFFQQFLLDKKKDVEVDEIFSLFGILDTVEDEFLNLLEDIVVHEHVSIYRTRSEKSNDFFLPVSFYNTGNRLCYYFYKEIEKEEKFFPRKLLFQVKDFYVDVVTPEKFLDVLMANKSFFLDAEDTLGTLLRVGKWSFLNVFQKKYLVSLGVVDLRKILKEVTLIAESASSYDASKQVAFEKQVVTVLNTLAEIFIVNEQDVRFIPVKDRALFLQEKKDMEKIVRTYIQFIRMSISDKGYFDVIAGDAFYVYENSIKEEYYGKSDLDSLKDMIRPKTRVLAEKILQDNDIFGVVDNFSTWVVRRFARGSKISFGIKQKGVLSIGTKDYHLVPGALKYTNDYFVKRMQSYANAVQIELDDFLRMFDFSRIALKNIQEASQLNFVMMSAYIQKSIKEVSPYETLGANYFKFAKPEDKAFLLMDAQLFERGYIGGSWIEYFINQGHVIYIFDALSGDFTEVEKKLQKVGFKSNDLDNEIESIFKWVEGRNTFSSEMLLIENKEDIVAKIVSKITSAMASKGKRRDIYVYVSAQDINADMLFYKIEENVKVFLVEDATSIFQCVSEFFARCKESDLTMLLRRLNYSKYDKRYFSSRNDETSLKRDPKTMSLVDIFMLAQKKIRPEVKKSAKKTIRKDNSDA